MVKEKDAQNEGKIKANYFLKKNYTEFGIGQDNISNSALRDLRVMTLVP